MKWNAGKGIVLTEKQKEEVKVKQEAELKEKAEAFMSEYKEIKRKHGFEFIAVVGYEPTRGMFPQLLIQGVKEPEIPQELKELNEK